MSRRNKTGPVFSPQIRAVSTLTGERSVDSVLFTVEAMPEHPAAAEDAASSSGVVTLHAFDHPAMRGGRLIARPIGDRLGAGHVEKSLAPRPVRERRRYKTPALFLSSLAVAFVTTLVFWNALYLD